MGMVKVWNMNTMPLVEKFKGKEIVIPPQSYIEMEYYEAYEYKAQYKAPILDQDSKPKVPDSYKMVRITEGEQAAPIMKDDKNTCIVCKFQAPDEKALMSHITAAHATQAVKDEEAEKALLEAQKKKKAG